MDAFADHIKRNPKLCNFTMNVFNVSDKKWMCTIHDIRMHAGGQFYSRPTMSSQGQIIV